jgi:predicted MPP superfamily phosphohydrolase
LSKAGSRSSSGGRRPLLVAVALSLAAIAAVIWVGLNNAGSTPIVREANLHVEGLPKGSGSVRIALLSDIHLGNRAMTSERLAEIVDQVNVNKPDLILLAGDFVTGHDPEDALERAVNLTRPLKRLRAPLGVVAVLGNHDHWTAPGAVRTALMKAGISVLENQAVRRGPFAIIGIGDRFSGYDDFPAALLAAQRIGGLPIVLTHSPDIVPNLPENQALILAGHTHCGQVVLPWIGPLLRYSPRNHWRRLYNPRYRCGVVREGKRVTIITAGVGSGTLPVRIGAMPDWWLVTLEP